MLLLPSPQFLFALSTDTPVNAFDSAGNAVKEKLVFEDSLVGAHHIVNAQGIPEQACHTALAVTPERMLLLGSQGMYCRTNMCIVCVIS